MDRRAADRLDDPGGKARKVGCNAPAARRGALIEPGKLAERRPFVIDEILVLDAGSGLEANDLDSFLRQLVGKRATPGAGADDDDDA
jgi:hypothetical protein